MQFDIRNVEVLEKRNKYMNPCTPGAPDVDAEIVENVLGETGCKPPYWNSSSSLPLCSKLDDMKKAADLIEKMLDWVPSRRISCREALNHPFLR